MLLTRTTHPRTLLFADHLQHLFGTPSGRHVLAKPMTSMASATTPAGADVQFARGYDSAQGQRDLATLVAPSGAWRLTATGRGIERTIRFRGFRQTWDFLNLVAVEAQRRNHHPEWANVYHTAFVRWTTHVPAGLSEKDIMMARFCDEKAKELGELPAQERCYDDVKALVDRCATSEKPST
ncbi:hypothetical protein K3495_g1131 [Podosphaera aphanis]|nr:hypothetical protein K3495_g1131 [Podosphaera aphanis]